MIAMKKTDVRRALRRSMSKKRTERVLSQGFNAIPQKKSIDHKWEIFMEGVNGFTEDFMPYGRESSL